MIRYRFMLMVVMIVSLVMAVALITSCEGGFAPPAEPPTEAPEPTAAPITATEPTVAPTEAPEPTATPTEIPEPTATPTEEAERIEGPTQIDLDAIFPPGRGREVALVGCSACHNFVPLVILQLNAEEWDYILRDHREKAPAISEEDYLILQDYLTEHFGPDDPVPELPQELLDQWTSY